MPNFSEESLAKLATCDPQLQQLFREVIKHWDCKVIEGHRGKDAQDRAFAEGKSKVKWPHGNHNSFPARAVDVVPFPIDWQDRERFSFFAGFVLGLAKSMGINVRWGGDWSRDGVTKDERFSDMPHFELFEGRK